MEEPIRVERRLTAKEADGTQIHLGLKLYFWWLKSEISFHSWDKWYRQPTPVPRVVVLDSTEKWLSFDPWIGSCLQLHTSAKILTRRVYMEGCVMLVFHIDLLISSHENRGQRMRFCLLPVVERNCRRENYKEARGQRQVDRSTSIALLTFLFISSSNNIPFPKMSLLKVLPLTCFLVK